MLPGHSDPQPQWDTQAYPETRQAHAGPPEDPKTAPDRQSLSERE